MAKVGLESFLLNCHTNDNLAEIEAIYGIKGFAVIVRLWQKIYSEKGYYCEWTERSPLLFLSNWFGGNSGVDLNLIKEVVKTALQNGLFNKSLYDKYHILTSDGIQKRYFDVAKRRKEIEVIEEYLLVSVANLGVNVCRNQENVNIFNENVNRNQTRKGKESKGKENNNMCKADALALFEQLWKMYPCKKGKGQVSDKDKTKLLEIGLEEMTRAINRYKSELEKDKEWRKPQNGSTFFHSGYIDYLDANFEESKTTPTKKSGFNNFKHNEYDFDELEKELLSN